MTVHFLQLQVHMKTFFFFAFFKPLNLQASRLSYSSAAHNTSTDEECFLLRMHSGTLPELY